MIELIKKILRDIFGSDEVLKQRNKELENDLALAKDRIKEFKAMVDELLAKISDLEAQLEAGVMKPPVAPKIKGKILWMEVMDLLEKLFPNDMDKVHISDKEFEITAISEMRRFIDWDNTNRYPYIAEVHDCDDFALALAGSFAKYPEWSGFPQSFIWAKLGLGYHAFSICIAWPSFEDRTPTVYFIEPQNDWEMAEEMLEEMKLTLLPM